MNTKTYTKQFIVETEREAGRDRIVSRITRSPDGHLDSDGDEPAILKINVINGRTTEARSWYKMGQLHREGAPAMIATDLDTGVVFQQVFAVNGLIHRDGHDDPASILLDRDTGNPVDIEYHTHGMRDREGGAALVQYDRQTGRVRKSEHWRKGQQFHPTGDPSPEGPS